MNNDNLRDVISTNLQSKPNSPSVSSSVTNNRWPASKIFKKSFYGNSVLKMADRSSSPLTKPVSPENISLIAPA